VHGYPYILNIKLWKAIYMYIVLAYPIFIYIYECYKMSDLADAKPREFAKHKYCFMYSINKKN